MRFVTFVAMLFVAVPAYGQENDAEKLFRAMEKKIRSAKTVLVTVDGQINDKGKNGTIKVDFRSSEGEKCQMVMEMDLSGKAMKMKLVSDGKQLYLSFDDKGGIQEALDDKIVEQAVGMLARGGIVAVFPGSPKRDPKQPFELDKAAPAKDFKLGAKEKIGKKDTQVVEYDLTLLGASLKASVWIDTATQLPVKREVVGQEKGKEVRLSESYSTFTVDAKIDEKAFELPK
jgi:outer membrane lipoprotein-sorting protein